MNVWLALTWEGHEHHGVARMWFQGLDAADRLGFCRFTQISLLRLLTTRAVMNVDTMTQIIEAWRAYDQWLDDDRVLFLSEPPNLEAGFRTMSRRSHADPKMWADAYLAAFANAEEMKLVTFDRALMGRVEHSVFLEP